MVRRSTWLTCSLIVLAGEAGGFLLPAVALAATLFGFAAAIAPRARRVPAAEFESRLAALREVLAARTGEDEVRAALEPAREAAAGVLTRELLVEVELSRFLAETGGDLSHAVRDLSGHLGVIRRIGEPEPGVEAAVYRDLGMVYLHLARRAYQRGRHGADPDEAVASEEALLARVGRMAVDELFPPDADDPFPEDAEAGDPGGAAALMFRWYYLREAERCLRRADAGYREAGLTATAPAVRGRAELANVIAMNGAAPEALRLAERWLADRPDDPEGDLATRVDLLGAYDQLETARDMVRDFGTLTFAIADPPEEQGLVAGPVRETVIFPAADGGEGGPPAGRREGPEAAPLEMGEMGETPEFLDPAELADLEFGPPVTWEGEVDSEDFRFHLPAARDPLPN